MLETTRSAAQICGPALGGALVSLLTAPIAVLASAVLFACLRCVDPAHPAAAEHDLGGVQRRECGRLRDGLRIVVHDGSLRAIATATCVYQFSFTALTTVYLLFVTRTLDLPGAVVGLVLAAFGPGVLIGSLLSSWLPRWFGYGRVVVFAALISDLVMLCTSAAARLRTGSGGRTDHDQRPVRRTESDRRHRGDGHPAGGHSAPGPGTCRRHDQLPRHGPDPARCPPRRRRAPDAFGIRTALFAATAGMFLSPLALSLSPLARLRLAA